MQGLQVAELAPVPYSQLERNTTGPPAEMLWSENRHALLGPADRRLSTARRTGLAQMPREIRPPRRQDRRVEACRCRKARSGALWSLRTRANSSSSPMGRNMRPWLSQSSMSAAAAARASSSVPPGRTRARAAPRRSSPRRTSTTLVVDLGLLHTPPNLQKGDERGTIHAWLGQPVRVWAGGSARGARDRGTFSEHAQDRNRVVRWP